MYMKQRLTQTRVSGANFSDQFCFSGMMNLMFTMNEHRMDCHWKLSNIFSRSIWISYLPSFSSYTVHDDNTPLDFLQLSSKKLWDL